MCIRDRCRRSYKTDADDLLLMAAHGTCSRLKTIAEPVLRQMNDWASERSLEFGYGKCCYFVVPTRAGTRGAWTLGGSWSLFMGDHRLKRVDSLDYLGLRFHKTLTWSLHLARAEERASKMHYRLCRLSAATYGLKPELVKMVYSTVTERQVLYGAPIWYDDTIRQRQRLISLQRKMLISITKCYRTVSNLALSVLAGVLPLDLRASLESVTARLTRWGLSDEAELNVRKPCLGTGLTSNAIDLWRPEPAREKLLRIGWTADLKPRTPYSYYTDGSKQEDGRNGCAFLLVAEGQVLTERCLRLSDGATVYAAEVTAIKAAVGDAVARGLGAIDVFTDSRSAADALNSLLSPDKGTAEIKEMVIREGVELHMHWLKAHVGHTYNERADVLAKEATQLGAVDIQLKLTKAQAKKRLSNAAIAIWQQRWTDGAVGRTTYEVFPRVRLKRIQGDFYVNQVLTGHGVFGDYQEYFHPGSDSSCFCGSQDSSMAHVLFDCPTWRLQREKFFPRNYRARTLGDLCLDFYSRKGVRAIVEDFLVRRLRPP